MAVATVSCAPLDMAVNWIEPCDREKSRNSFSIRRDIVDAMKQVFGLTGRLTIARAEL